MIKFIILRLCGTFVEVQRAYRMCCSTATLPSTQRSQEESSAPPTTSTHPMERCRMPLPGQTITAYVFLKQFHAGESMGLCTDTLLDKACCFIMSVVLQVAPRPDGSLTAGTSDQFCPCMCSEAALLHKVGAV